MGHTVQFFSPRAFQSIKQEPLFLGYRLHHALSEALFINPASPTVHNLGFPPCFKMKKRFSLKGSDDDSSEDGAKKKLSSRVWNLLNKGKVGEASSGGRCQTKMNQCMLTAISCRFSVTSSTIRFSPMWLQVSSDVCDREESDYVMFAFSCQVI